MSALPEQFAPPLEATMLTDAFARFSEASQRLEDRHTRLQEEIVALKAQLQEKDREIQRAARLATLGETAAAIAHEVRNPLGAMKLLLSLIREDLAANPASQKLVDQMGSSIQSIEHVVSNILHFTKERAEHVTPINLQALISEQVVALEPLHNKQATIQVSCEGVPFIFGDEHALRRAMYNLLLNSLQATKYKGTIRVSVTSSDQSAHIVVHDNGPGVPQQLLTKLFEPFVTTKSEGTGLGLAIVRKIIEQHGGSIVGRNNDGAEFVIELPRRQ